MDEREDTMDEREDTMYEREDGLVVDVEEAKRRF